MRFIMNNCLKYTSFFRMRFIAGLQYRAAALGGIATQFVWGTMELLMFRAFYQVNPDAFPMTLQELSSYIWLQQALLALFMIWYQENDIFKAITEGGVAYELCRPTDLYSMWFVRSIAGRLSQAFLRCVPIILFAAFVPAPFGMGLPAGVRAGIWFIITTILGIIVVVAFIMLVYISTFYTYSPAGVRMISISLVEFFAGAVIPLPFLPNGIRQVVELLPFASMQNVPLRVYSGNISGTHIYVAAGLQLFWAVALIWLGRRLMAAALKRVVVQGG